MVTKSKFQIKDYVTEDFSFPLEIIDSINTEVMGNVEFRDVLVLVVDSFGGQAHWVC